ncbi:MAG: hypothetical protein HY520_04615 [Candidatus Aenigmarchaeota archaeon]|nr:hypothetical protein [Candidatus Aenigmarchaeota archaeon]
MTAQRTSGKSLAAAARGHPRKGQMYILTMVFMAGLVFTVYSSLSQYAAVELAEPLEGGEAALLAGVERAARTAVSTDSCAQAADQLARLQRFVERTAIQGAALDLDPEVDCAAIPSWTAAATLSYRSVALDLSNTITLR